MPAVADSYEISNTGRLKRTRPGPNTWAGRLMRPKRNGQYHAYTLTANGYRGTHYVHELVALAFIGPRPPGYEINHRNLDKLDNRVDNLEYVTKAGNAQHAARHHVLARWKPGEREEIRRLYHSGVPSRLIGRMFRTTASDVWRIAMRRNAHLPDVRLLT